LIPTTVQCTIPHPPYIDAFPFPSFRDNLIQFESLGLPEKYGISRNQLCQDMHDGGLLIWGTTDGKHGGVAWDPRSWEAAPWFLKRYHMIIGEELKYSSRWWRNMRGDILEELD